MQFFRDLSVRAKLFGGFGTVLVLTAVMGVVLLTELGSVNKAGEYLGAKAVPSVESINSIALSAVDFRRAQLKYVLTPKSAGGVQAKADWTADGANVEAALQKYASMVANAQDREVWHQGRSGWTTLKNQ